MAASDLRERYAKSQDEQQRDLEKAAALTKRYETIREQIRGLESAKSKANAEAMRLRHYVQQAQYIEDPLICEPHGKEACTEPPGAMSAGAMMHLDDGEVCYAASIGRRSEFTDEELATYRRIKGKR